VSGTAPASARSPIWRNLGAISSGRSFVLAGGAAIIGLVLAGAGLFAARGTSSLVIPPEDVAIVNQQPIARTDLLAQLRALYGEDPAEITPQQRRKALNDMIREELLVQRAKELDVASVDPDVRAAMVAAVEQSVAADAMIRQPGQAELRAYYQAHQERYASEGTISVSNLAFGGAHAALRAVQSLRKGADLAQVLTQEHGREISSEGQAFYFASRIHLGDSLFEVARRLHAGEISEPLVQPDGVHVLVVRQNHPPVARPYAAAQDQVLNDFRNDEIARLEAKSAEFLRKRANILIAKDAR